MHMLKIAGLGDTWSYGDSVILGLVQWLRIDPDAVRRFLGARKTPNSVAEREARRGLDRLP
jgi:hypothetical protein